MKITMPYGKGHVDVEVPERGLIGVLEPPIQATRPEEEAIADALAHPVGSPSLRQIVRKGERSTIVVPDATRRCGAPKFLPVLIGTLNQCGISDSDILILFANGSHGTQTADRRREVVGSEVYSRVATLDHDCLCSEDLVFLGHTNAGTPVSLNKHVVKAERLIVAGGVSHHHLTGYAGGPKMLNPGCAALETILKCHGLGISSDGQGLYEVCDAGVTLGNPIYTDIVDSTKFVQTDFCLHLIVDQNGLVAGACAGAQKKSFAKARKLADLAYRASVGRKVDIVIASCGGAPFDDDLIKMFRAMRNASRVLRDDGHLILLGECGQGVGNHEFLDYFGPRSVEDLASLLQTEYHSYGNTALGLRELLHRKRITIVGQLGCVDARRMGLECATDVQQTVDDALADLSPDGRLVVIPNAHFSMPMVQEK